MSAAGPAAQPPDRVSLDLHRADVAALVRGITLRPVEWMPVAAALLAAGGSRRVLADDLVAPIALPPFANSQMDGFAVRAADLADATAQSPVALPSAAEIVAGGAVVDLAPGAAAPIMTGAPIPAGADAVVPVERVESGAFPHSPGDPVRFTAPVEPGTFVRDAGSDITRGALLLAAGTTLGAAQWGVLAASGVDRVPVRARLRVLLVSTGLELAAPGEELGPARIHDANSVSLAVALADAGAEVTSALVPTDDPARLLDELARHDVDLVVTTGGVSAGAHEVVREALEPLGVSFRGVAMQPGGPQGWGVAALDRREVAVVAFPGNPVSALVSFEVLLRAELRRRAGLTPAERPRRVAPLADALDSPPSHQVRRGTLDDSGRVHVVGGPSSHLLHAYARSTHLVHVPAGVTRLEAGDEVEVWQIEGTP